MCIVRGDRGSRCPRYYGWRCDEWRRIDKTHHSIVKGMLYEQSRLSLGYVIGALPIFALIGGRVEVALDDIMVYDILEEFKVDLCLGR